MAATEMRSSTPDLSVEAYNYRSFRARQVVQEVRSGLKNPRIPVGAPAPDFELPLAGGGSVRLRELRGRPVLLRFVSFT